MPVYRRHARHGTTSKWSAYERTDGVVFEIRCNAETKATGFKEVVQERAPEMRSAHTAHP